MDLYINGKMRNYIFIVVSGVIFIALIVMISMAEKQNAAFKEDYFLYQQAISLIDKQQYAEAQKKLEQLNPENRGSYQAIYSRAICAANTGELKTATRLMQKAREIRPVYVMDQNYLVQYGIMLYRLGELDRAKLYFVESQKYNQNSQVADEAGKYLQLIKQNE